MKTLPLFFALILSFGVYAQETPDPSVLKSEIKGLEKVVKEQEKDIAKLEKDLAKIRPESEQAMRDAKNISDMRDRKKAEFDAFEFDKKSAELKTLKKEAKSTAKDLSKTTKSKTKLDSKIKDMDRQREVLSKSVNSKQSEVDDLNAKLSVHSAEDQKQMRLAAKSKEPQDSLLLAKTRLFNSNNLKLKEAEKSLAKENKSLSKVESSMKSDKSDLAKFEDQETLLTTETENLNKQVEEQTAVLESMNPKAIEKELSELQKQATAAQTTYEKLNNTLEQQQVIINEKHDVMESKKQEIREKQSVLDKL